MAGRKNHLSTYSLVVVVWDDAHMSMDEYSAAEVERDFHKAEQVKSFGLLVRDDEKGITLAQDEGMADEKFRHVIFIPRGMIREVVNLGIPKKPQTRTKKKKTTVPDLNEALREDGPSKIA